MGHQVKLALMLVWGLWACSPEGHQAVPSITQDVVVPAVSPEEDLLTKKLVGTTLIHCINSSKNTMVIEISGKVLVKLENGTWVDCQGCKNRVIRVVNDGETQDHYLDVMTDAQGQMTATLNTLNPPPLGFYLMKKGFSPMEKMGEQHPCDPYGCFTTPEDLPVKNSLSFPEDFVAPECPSVNTDNIQLLL